MYMISNITSDFVIDIRNMASASTFSEKNKIIKNLKFKYHPDNKISWNDEYFILLNKIINNELPIKDFVEIIKQDVEIIEKNNIIENKKYIFTYTNKSYIFMILNIVLLYSFPLLWYLWVSTYVYLYIK